MYYIIEGHDFVYDLQTIIQVFYPNENYAVLEQPSKDGITVLSRVEIENNVCYAAVFDCGKIILEKSLEIYDNNEKEIKRLIKLSIYYCLSAVTGFRPSWGIVTGIRPSKRVYDMRCGGWSDAEIKNMLVEKLLVTEKKADLAIEIAKAEHDILNTNDGSTISIYAGIPFCPTRCTYCSFAAYPIDKYKAKVDLYLETLAKELEFVRRYSDNKYLESFYIGGGTPTSLVDYQLDTLLKNITESFDIENAKEFTIEAGRPDTITKEKLSIMKAYGVSRISINPQTMHDKTLKIIGRNHTVSGFLHAYELAVNAGFENINIDLILGLPYETADEVSYTMNEITRLNPANITVHTLAIKRASELKAVMSDTAIASAAEMEQMIEISSDFCRDAGLMPYYMYRQKNSSGNFENVGYAKKGFECLYNVQIMGERQTIIATGAGAVTKVVFPEENRLERVFNVKNVDEYICRIDEMLDRKKKGVIL